MNESTRQELIAFAQERALAHPVDVERPVSEGVHRYRLRLYRFYAITIVAMIIVAAGLVIAHPATGLLAPTITVDSISLDPPTPTLFVDDSVDVVATVHRSDGTEAVSDTVEWSSSDPDVATVSGGRVTGVSVGAATITAEQEGVIGIATVTVTEEPEATLTTITVDPSEVNLDSGEEVPLTATGTYDDDTQVDLTLSVAWTSSDPQVATVDDDGRVRAIAPGSATITASESGAVGTSTVTVGPVEPVTLVRIRIEPNTLELRAGTSQQFTVVGEYSDQSSHTLEEGVAWNSSNVKTAQVTAGGIVTAVDWNTQAVITATVAEFSATATVTVPPARLVSIIVTPDPTTINQVGEVKLSATGTYENGHEEALTGVLWASADSAVADVDQTGFVTATGTGYDTVEITATLDEVSGSAFVTVEYQEP